MKTRSQRFKLSRITRKSPRIHPLRSVYGEMILKKGTILYHTSESAFKQNITKPMLFLTFHPSEWIRNPSDYVTKFILNRDVSLFFMVGAITGSRIFPLLDKLIDTPGNNLAKREDEKLTCFVRYLEKAGFDGWFSTIEGSPPVEIALINNLDLVSVISTNPITWNWKNGNYPDPNNLSVFVPKNWGKTYEILSHHIPIELKINRRYEPMINTFIEQVKKNDPDGNVFSILLKNAKIQYINAPFKQIKWVC